MSNHEIPVKDIWKTKYLNELNHSCCASGYSISGRPLTKSQWQKMGWTINDLEKGRRSCCSRQNEFREERELCVDCSKWLDKYYRELAVREAETRGTDTLVPLLEKQIENQQQLLAKLDEILVAVRQTNTLATSAPTKLPPVP